MRKEMGRNSVKAFGIRKKISYAVGAVVICTNVLLGVIVSILSFSSSSGVVSSTINETSEVASNLVSQALKEYKAIAYETGSIARLADPEKSLKQKQEIIDQRVNDHNFEDAYILDDKGKDIFTGNDFSDKDFYIQGMKGNTYVSTPAYNDVEGKVTTAVAAPLWKDGIPHTEPIGVIVYIPDGEFINNIVRSIKVGKSGTAFMVDTKGTNIADEDSTIVGVENGIEKGKSSYKFKSYGKIVEKMAAGEKGVANYSYKGTTRVVGYSPVEDTDGWSIAVVAVRREFLGRFYLSLGFIALFVAASTFIGVKIGVRKGKGIAAPISECVDRLTLLNQGDLHSEIPEIHSNDETEILVKNVKETVQVLQTVISDIKYNLKEISEGNLTLSIDKTYDGDYAVISESFREITLSLNNVMKEIDGNAVRVASGADELSNAAQELAEGATNQASAVEELTATITDISEKIHENAESSENAATIVKRMNQQLQDSNNQMIQTTAAMQKIKDASQKIEEIIKTINSIASQTNLLSLNAAIEAARAGDAGKGFAVVADQVRELSEQSALAAKNTTELIQNAISAVEEGTKYTEITAKSLNMVVADAESVYDSVSGIATASNVQASAATQIKDGINQIAGVVEMNSATSEESAASSEELSSESTLLKELIGKFKFN